MFTVLAQSGSQGGQASSGWMGMIPFVLMIGIFYVILILPMRRRQKAHDAMVQALAPGDKIYTNGGILGTVKKVEENTLKLNIATGVDVTVLRSQVSGKVTEEKKP